MLTRIYKMLIFIAFLSATNGPAIAQPIPEVFIAKATGDLSPAANDKIAQLRKEHAAGAITIVKLNPAALVGAPVNSPRMFNLSSTERFQALTRESSKLAGGRTFYRGEVAAIGNLPKGDATLIIDGANATGTITAPDGSRYQVRPVGGGDHAIIELDYAKLPTDEPPGSMPSGDAVLHKGMATAGVNGDAASGGTPTIDLLVGYTNNAASASGGIDSLIDLAIAETNASFANSGINAKVRLAGKIAVAYAETGKTFDTILSDFVANTSVSKQRDAVGADVAVLIINQSDYCGLADEISATAAKAFVIVHYGCATGYYSFAHEIGHLIGARHDLDVDPTLTPYAYGHAHLEKKTSGGWRTIMGYNCNSGACPTRIQYWSNPNVSYSGTATGNAAREDNVRVWNERATTVAGFRPPKVAPPQ